MKFNITITNTDGFKQQIKVEAASPFEALSKAAEATKNSGVVF